MKHIHNLEDLFFEQLKEQYHATRQQMETFPKLREKTSNNTLKESIDHHIGQNKDQLDRIGKVFAALDRNRHGEVNEAAEGLIREAIKLSERCSDAAARDAGIITSIQHFNHYNIASFGTLRTYAKELGFEEPKNLLGKCLEEEKSIDKELTALAEKVINLSAIH
ncbi:DUF892 family protein [Echinicola jeungdonensis]|uniref:Ferritin-like domain-containing protein n=1 Tax=Echinicola jeungdonensis TaxID=709343 RepID=A0ABV5J246_9BACT|nr:DUF892 family protein [Echinicola jeungdonensis]MDN3671104.1 DUF892 family protein [Echinicola jeungdonensis]